LISTSLDFLKQNKVNKEIFIFELVKELVQNTMYIAKEIFTFHAKIFEALNLFNIGTSN
jgi:hypothetical protein